METKTGIKAQTVRIDCGIILFSLNRITLFWKSAGCLPALLTMVIEETVDGNGFVAGSRTSIVSTLTEVHPTNRRMLAIENNILTNLSVFIFFSIS